MTITTIVAGNIAYIDRTFTRADPLVSVVGTTAAVAVTDPAGTSTGLTETVTNPTADTVRVQATWTIPDNATAGWYTITFDLATAMVAAYEERVFVVARVLPTVPA